MGMTPMPVKMHQRPRLASKMTTEGFCMSESLEAQKGDNVSGDTAQVSVVPPILAVFRNVTKFTRLVDIEGAVREYRAYIDNRAFGKRLIVGIFDKIPNDPFYQVQTNNIGYITDNIIFNVPLSAIQILDRPCFEDVTTRVVRAFDFDQCAFIKDVGSVSIVEPLVDEKMVEYIETVVRRIWYW
jgi:hypothetical protein